MSRRKAALLLASIVFFAVVMITPVAYTKGVLAFAVLLIIPLGVLGMIGTAGYCVYRLIRPKR